MNKDRILGYEKAIVLTKEEILEVSGGNGSTLTKQYIPRVSVVPTPDIEVVVVFD